MEYPERYWDDILFFFDRFPAELELYRAFSEQMERVFDQARVKVQKSQISFYGRHLFAAASLPIRRKKGWPEHCLIVAFGLGRKLDSARIAVAVEPYPGRWTHHMLLTAPQQLDAEWLSWMEEAWYFSQTK